MSLPSPTALRPVAGVALAPVLALTLNALIWGTSWWPFRQLYALGLHPLWTTVIAYGAAALLIAGVRPAALGRVIRTPTLWILLLASGTTNASFNWAVTTGDVVRVVLLFNLMPIWALLLARPLLGEAFTRQAGLRVMLALAGAAIVLWPQQPAAGGAGVWDAARALPWPRDTSDWLALLGGFAFALNNVMLRRESHRPEEDRALAMFLGGVLVAGTLVTAMALQGRLPWPPDWAPGWLLGALALTALFLASNMALQYGAARLPASVTAVVMLTEVLFASVSATLLGAGTVTTPLLIGGGLILLAALLATLGSGPARSGT